MGILRSRFHIEKVVLHVNVSEVEAVLFKFVHISYSKGSKN